MAGQDRSNATWGLLQAGTRAGGTAEAYRRVLQAHWAERPRPRVQVRLPLPCLRPNSAHSGQVAEGVRSRVRLAAAPTLPGYLPVLGNFGAACSGHADGLTSWSTPRLDHGHPLLSSCYVLGLLTMLPPRTLASGPLCPPNFPCLLGALSRMLVMLFVAISGCSQKKRRV